MSEKSQQAAASAQIPMNPKDIAATRDKKIPLHLLEHAADVEIAQVMAHGAYKYGRRNFYETPIRANVYIGAIRRHIGAYADGEDIDPESGLPHLAHIGANIHVLFAALKQGTFTDDRAPESQSDVQKRLSDASNSGDIVHVGEHDFDESLETERQHLPTAAPPETYDAAYGLHG